MMLTKFRYVLQWSSSNWDAYNNILICV